MFYPLLGFAVCGIPMFLSRALRKDDSWARKTYDRLGGGTLLLCLIVFFLILQILFDVWTNAFGL